MPLPSLTGQPPYPDRDGAVVLRMARRGDLGDALSRLEGCGADAELIALARRCLMPEPAGRPREAGGAARPTTASAGGSIARSPGLASFRAVGSVGASGRDGRLSGVPPARPGLISSDSE